MANFPDNILRVGVEARHLPKKRKLKKGSKASFADIEEYNQRQVMRCVETRTRKIGSGLDIASVPVNADPARLNLSFEEHIAAKAYFENDPRSVSLLIGLVLEVIQKTAEEESWQFKDDPLNPKLELLAYLTVDSLMHPGRYLKQGRNKRVESISAMALAMQCDRKTYRQKWQAKLRTVKETPAKWLGYGVAAIESGNIKRSKIDPG